MADDHTDCPRCKGWILRGECECSVCGWVAPPGDRNAPTDDDAAVAELMRSLEAWGAPPEIEGGPRRLGPEEIGNLAAVLLDIGNLADGAPTLVRALGPLADGRRLFEGERRRLELPADRVTVRSVSWEQFHRAGGCAVLAVAPYRRNGPEGESLRCLALLVAVQSIHP